jgi:hypothetical protein
MSEKLSSVVYSKNTIEFVTVAAETCLFLESAGSFSKNDFMERALRLLPLLYLKTSLIENTEQLLEDDPEHFVTESDYESIKNSVADVLGSSDRYLEVFHPDIQLSETGIATDISEDLADIYQDLKDFLLNFQIGNEEVMNDALALCLTSFREYWGQRLVNCMRALHNANYNTNSDDEMDNASNEEGDDESEKSINKNNFLSHQHSDTLDAFLNSFSDQDGI